MNFTLNEAIEVLERTPRTLQHFLSGLSPGWLHCNEGEGTWNAVEVSTTSLKVRTPTGFPGWNGFFKREKAGRFLRLTGTPI